MFDRRRTPLTVWLQACWMFASGKDGMSALSLQRSLEIGSYPTAWAMLHRLRSVLVRPGRDRLTGTAQVDETYIGGEEPGLRGGRAKGKKALVGVAVEVQEPRGFGRARMAILADGSAASLHSFVTEHVEPGARVITDDWAGYRGIDKLGYTYEPRSRRAGEDLIDELDRLAQTRGYPAVLRRDNGPELACAAMADWAGRRVELSFMPPGEPCRNGNVEAFNSRVRDECLSINIFCSLAQARVVMSDWKEEHNQRHSALGYQAPARYAAACTHL